MTDAQLRDAGIPTAARHCTACGNLAQESDGWQGQCQPCADSLEGLYTAEPDRRIQIGPLDI